MSGYINVIEEYKKKASDVAFLKNTHSYKYLYWIKTPRGMRLDEEKNHFYGELRDGYDKWKNDYPDNVASISGVVSLRKITKRKTGDVIGYITEEKIPDDTWQSELKQIADDCFEKLCELLDVVDKDLFKYYIQEEVCCKDAYAVSTLDAMIQLDTMVMVYDDYLTDPMYKKMIDKMVG